MYGSPGPAGGRGRGKAGSGSWFSTGADSHKFRSYFGPGLHTHFVKLSIPAQPAMLAPLPVRKPMKKMKKTAVKVGAVPPMQATKNETVAPVVAVSPMKAMKKKRPMKAMKEKAVEQVVKRPPMNAEKKAAVKVKPGSPSKVATVDADVMGSCLAEMDMVSIDPLAKKGGPKVKRATAALDSVAACLPESLPTGSEGPDGTICAPTADDDGMGPEEQAAVQALQAGTFETRNTIVGRLWLKEIRKNPKLKQAYQEVPRVYALQRKFRQAQPASGEIFIHSK